MPTTEQILDRFLYDLKVSLRVESPVSYIEDTIFSYRYFSRLQKWLGRGGGKYVVSKTKAEPEMILKLEPNTFLIEIKFDRKISNFINFLLLCKTGFWFENCRPPALNISGSAKARNEMLVILITSCVLLGCCQMYKDHRTNSKP